MLQNVYNYTKITLECVLSIVLTLTYLIIVQDVINVQAGKFPGINKRAGCNKAVQVGIFQESIVKKTCRLEKFQKLINVQDVIRLCRLDFFKKIIKRAACLLDRLEYPPSWRKNFLLLLKGGIDQYPPSGQY